MSKEAYSLAADDSRGRELVPAGTIEEVPSHVRARPIPRISIQAFCEEPATAGVLQMATSDRRLAKSHVSVHMGGAAAAGGDHQEKPTPHPLLIQTSPPPAEMIAEVRPLGEGCGGGAPGGGLRPNKHPVP